MAKNRARFPIDLGHVYQAQVDFVDQGRGLQRLHLAFILHVPAGYPVQFVVDLVRQPIEGSPVTAAPGFQ
jgi:hypothetical protein